MSSAAALWKLFWDQAERGFGIGLKLFGFIAEAVFTFIPEPCSSSSWNSVRNHPGIAFTFDRIPHARRQREEQACLEHYAKDLRKEHPAWCEEQIMAEAHRMVLAIPKAPPD